VKELSMPAAPPQPLVNTFVVCREVWQIAGSNEVVLIGPFASISSISFPIQVAAGAYAQLTNAHGEYKIGLELRDSQDSVVWRWPGVIPINEPDPLMPARLLISGLAVEFPRPGRFDMVLTSNGSAVGRYAILAQPAPK
jgi:hypothetical protein